MRKLAVVIEVPDEDVIMTYNDVITSFETTISFSHFIERRYYYTSLMDDDVRMTNDDVIKVVVKPIREMAVSIPSDLNALFSKLEEVKKKKTTTNYLEVVSM